MTGAGDVTSSRLARVALSALAEPGNQVVWRRVAALGPAPVLEQVLAGCAATDQDLWRATQPRLSAGDPWQLAATALARAERLDARVVIPEDNEWPHQLEALIRICAAARAPAIERDAAPPLCLWARGPRRLDDALAWSVAVVGARAATGYGTHLARELGYGLAGHGWTVVSGGAYGIDAHAHRGALAAGGTTAVVLACGVERAYPAAHANLFDRIAEDGLLLSEWPPDSDPYRRRFLVRNRVIAAATRGTVVVEASARSGARQTLRRAGQLGRAQMVVPGPVTSAMSVGCHEELRELRDPPVRPVTGVPHILEEVGRLGVDLAPVARGPEHARDRLDVREQRLLDALLRRKPLSAEEVALRAGVPLGEAVRSLPALVLRGLVARREHGFVVASSAVRAPSGGPVPAVNPVSTADSSGESS